VRCPLLDGLLVAEQRKRLRGFQFVLAPSLDEDSGALHPGCALVGLERRLIVQSAQRHSHAPYVPIDVGGDGDGATLLLHILARESDHVALEVERFSALEPISTARWSTSYRCVA
jgi:hypothetical protein